MLDNFPDLENTIKKCVRCGQCRSVCPVFEEIGTEIAAPRARVYLAQKLHKGEIKPSQQVADYLAKCLLCEACSKDCPSGIQVHKYVALARTYVQNHLGFSMKRSIYKDVWASPGLLKGVTLGMWAWQKLGIRSFANGFGLTKLLPGDLGKAEKMLTSVPFKSAKSKLSQTIPPKGEKKFRVAYFLGCATDLLFPQVALATIDVLTRNGCEVVVPDNLKCCGIPQYGNGCRETALELAKQNIDTILDKDVDYIISDCGTCTATLKHSYSEWFEGTSIKEKADQFTAKVFDASEFLMKKVDLNQNLATLSYGKITYHDSCHMSRGIGVTKEPREILKNIPGLDFIEMKEADRCCGGGGSFCLTHYDLSSKILNKKVKNIISTGAQMMSTSCPMCTMNIAHGLRENNHPLSVKHPMELLSEAYQKAEQERALTS